MDRVTKFKSRNLYGESRKEERRRLLRARVSAILSGKSRNVSFGAGTSASQRARRRSILRRSGLSTKTPRYSSMYS